MEPGRASAASYLLEANQNLHHHSGENYLWKVKTILIFSDAFVTFDNPITGDVE
jgi:hypothetical protein